MDAAMNSAVSALQAQQAALSTVSDNLANSQTTGYKAVKTQFNDLLTQQGVGLNYPAGGVAATARQNVTAQGLVQSSSSNATTDMAITGNGMFAVSNGLGGSQDLFTRNGAFNSDSSGNLYLAGTNYYLLGWPTDAKGAVTSNNPDNLASLQNVNINKFNSSATATTSYSLQANLPAEAQKDAYLMSYQTGATPPTTENLSIAYAPLRQNVAIGTSPNTVSTTEYQMSVTASNTSATFTDGTNTSTAGQPLTYTVFVDGSGNVVQAADQNGAALSWPPTFTPSDIGSTAPNTAGLANAVDANGNSLSLTWQDLGSPFSQKSSISVYDSLGVQQSFPVTWTAAGNNDWIMTVSQPTDAAGKATTGTLSDSAGFPVKSYSYQVSFNSDGTLNSVTGLPTLQEDDSTGTPTFTQNLNSSGTAATAPLGTTGEPVLSATWNDKANSSLAGTTGAIQVNLGTAGGLGTGKTDGLSQFDTGETTPSISVKATVQNGVQYGQLTGVSVDSQTGNVIASYDNGQKVPIYKIPVVTFPNENGLSAQNDGVYQQSALSGTYTLNAAGSNGAGTITGQALEQSTVDTSTEFSNMISAQQAYSAASQVIGTDKQMFTSLIQVVQ
jgi:flagellar hook protein FlgE